MANQTNQPSKIAECWEFWTFWRATCCVSRRGLLRPCSVDGATQASVFSLASSYPILQKRSPPEMAAIHVEFVEMCAERLRVNPLATGKELVDEWNEHHAGGWGPSPAAGAKVAAKPGRGRSSGRADHFFDNHYITMQELYGIVDRTLPLPVAASTGVVARTRRSSIRKLGAKRRRPGTSPDPSPGQDTDADAASPPPEEARRARRRAAAAEGVARRRRGHACRAPVNHA